jgi:integrase
VPLREKTLWRMLYETAARASEVLALNVNVLDLERRRAPIRSKGGAIEYVYWSTGTARLLPRLINGRPRGPLFLSERQPAPARMPRAEDFCPDSAPASATTAPASCSTTTPAPAPANPDGIFTSSGTRPRPHSGRRAPHSS